MPSVKQKSFLCIKKCWDIHTRSMKLLKSIFFVIFALVLSLSPLLIEGCSSKKTIKLYDISTNQIETLSLEDYVAGVTAAEINESFSSEAIAAQSIIARTFAMWFITNSKSKYEGADISNDITEAQAYTKTIPDKIKEICKDTKGKVLKIDGEYFLPYYCSNCGGKTSLAQSVFEGNNTNYTSSVESFETAQNSKNYQWQATIEKSTILQAMSSLGKSLASVSSFEKGEVDSSGRCLTLKIGGTEVNANNFRLAVGSTLMKSCLLTDIEIQSSSVTISGVGYGHGVGLSQWGANIMAINNKTHKTILSHFYPTSTLSKI